jgi:hypothetical protein
MGLAPGGNRTFVVEGTKHQEGEHLVVKKGFGGVVSHFDCNNLVVGTTTTGTPR